MLQVLVHKVHKNNSTNGNKIISCKKESCSNLEKSFYCNALDYVPGNLTLKPFVYVISLTCPCLLFQDLKISNKDPFN
jgi:hypothetical protein